MLLPPDLIRDTVPHPAWAAVAILKTGVAKGQKAIVAAIKGGLRNAQLVHSGPDAQVGLLDPADDLQLLGCGIPHSSPPPCPIMFFLRRRFSSESSATHSFKSRISWRRPFNLTRGRLAPAVAGEPLLARFQKLFRPAVIQTLGDARAAAQGGDALLAAQARHHDPDLLLSRILLACLAANIPEPFSPPGRSCSLISVSSSFPSVTTMSQKSSVMQLPQFVPKALTSDSGEAFTEMKAARDLARSDLVISNRKATTLASSLEVVAKALRKEENIGWKITENGLRFGPADTPALMDGTFPTEQEILHVLQTRQQCEKTIHEYEELVK